MDMKRISLKRVMHEVQQAIQYDEIISALDAQTQKKYTKLLKQQLPDFDKDHFEHLTADDVILDLAGLLEHHDVVIALCYDGGCYVYQQI